MLRWLVGAYAVIYLLVRSVHLHSVTRLPPEQFRPVGMVSVLSAPLPPVLVTAALMAAIGAGLAFVAGRFFSLTGPLFAALFCWVTSYRNSWGMIFHTDNLVAVHLAVLGLTRSADALSLDARQRPVPAAATVYGYPPRLLALATVVTYALAGIAKLRFGGAHWLVGDTLRFYVAHDNLRKVELGDRAAPLAALFLRYRWLFRPLALVSLLVELGAPLVLVWRRLRLPWVLAAWSFHLGVLAMMWILFPYPLSGIAFAPFFPVECLVAGWSGRGRNRCG